MEMNVPPRLRELDLDALVGKPVDEARTAVQAAGGTLRAAGRNDALTLDYRTNRVTVIVEDGIVREQLGIG